MKRIKLYLGLIVVIGFVLSMNAHELGFPTAMFRKGNMYFFGNVGHPQDFVKAKEWFTKAADLGNVKAQNNLGLIYLDGRPGVPADIKLAQKFFGMAAESGYPPGLHNLARCLLRENNPERNPGKAFASFLGAAERGFPPSLGEVGLCYERGVGVPADQVKARTWFEKGADDGDPISCGRFGQLLFDGDGVTKDRPRGLALLVLGGDPLAVKPAREQASPAERKDSAIIYNKLLEDLKARAAIE